MKRRSSEQPAPWASPDPYSFMSVKVYLPAELKAWLGMIPVLDLAELEAY